MCKETRADGCAPTRSVDVTVKRKFPFPRLTVFITLGLINAARKAPPHRSDHRDDRSVRSAQTKHKPRSDRTLLSPPAVSCDNSDVP